MKYKPLRVARVRFAEVSEEELQVALSRLFDLLECDEVLLTPKEKPASERRPTKGKHGKNT
jgi:hypothetical protein